MFHKKEQTVTAFITAAVVLLLSGCASTPADTEPPREYISTRNHVNRWGKAPEKYTKSDYDFLLSFRTEGYGKLPVEKFNRKVLDWENEEAYHKTEEILIRVFHSLSEDDENADFILNTLGNTWNECEKMHFNTCEREKAPWHNGNAEYETYGDVFGDSVLLTGGYADFSFDYNIDTGKNLTVSQRDDMLGSIGVKLEEYMKEQPAEALKKEDAMEKTLSARAEELLKSMDSGITWGGSIDMDYYWEAPYESMGDSSTKDTELALQTDNTYTEKQYSLVMEKLKPKNYEQMSVSEYNRLINKIFYEDTEEENEVSYAYEMVMSSLSENDKNWKYLHDTVPRALDEYNVRTMEVCTGKNVDFSDTENIYVPLIEDVFGDEMEVGGIEGEYEFTYRIADADKLTVKAREDFIENVNGKVKAAVETKAEKGTVDKAGFKKLLESAGEEASNEYIEFTGCSLEYFEAY